MPNKKFWYKLLIIFAIFFAAFILIDDVFLPYYVSGTESKVPNVIGKNKDEAIKILQDANFNPIVQTSRFDEKFQKNEVIFQKPEAGVIVKENRRIYLTVSGGDPMIRVPSLISKTLRDATLSLERLGLIVGKIDSVESEFPSDIIVEQQYMEGREIAKGSTINIKISVGPKIGMVRVPNLLSKSLSEAENILKSNSLRLGNRIYIYSSSFLPNTIADQEPSEDTLVKIGDSVNVVLYRSK
ncbi:MAG: PASTA domain-containing protein [Ignavibacteriales bacterium]|nr:PASTA domain-containing protein [Ignavibacteriales bacterium]